MVISNIFGEYGDQIILGDPRKPHIVIIFVTLPLWVIAYTGHLFGFWERGALIFEVINV